MVNKVESLRMSSVPGFLTKSFEIFSAAEYADCCGWGPQGDTIVIRKIEQFSKQVLPKYFKHSNFQSFVRQLNMYDFHKTVQDPNHGEFRHPNFKQNKPELLSLIKRKANKPLPISMEPVGGASTLQQQQQQLKRLASKSSQGSEGSAKVPSTGSSFPNGKESATISKQTSSGSDGSRSANIGSKASSAGAGASLTGNKQSSGSSSSGMYDSNISVGNSQQLVPMNAATSGGGFLSSQRISEELALVKSSGALSAFNSNNSSSSGGGALVAELQKQIEFRKEFERRMESKMSRLESENEMLKQLFMESHSRNSMMQERVERVLRTLYSMFVSGNGAAAINLLKENTGSSSSSGGIVHASAGNSSNSNAIANGVSANKNTNMLLTDLQFLQANAQHGKQQLLSHEMLQQQQQQRMGTAAAPSGFQSQLPFLGSQQQQSQFPLLMPADSFDSGAAESLLLLDRLDSMGSLERLPSFGSDFGDLPSDDFLLNVPTPHPARSNSTGSSISNGSNRSGGMNSGRGGAANGFAGSRGIAESKASDHSTSARRQKSAQKSAQRKSGAPLSAASRGNSFEIAASSVSAPALNNSSRSSDISYLAGSAAATAGKPITRRSAVQYPNVTSSASTVADSSTYSRESSSVSAKRKADSGNATSSTTSSINGNSNINSSSNSINSSGGMENSMSGIGSSKRMKSNAATDEAAVVGAAPLSLQQPQLPAMQGVAGAEMQRMDSMDIVASLLETLESPAVVTGFMNSRSAGSNSRNSGGGSSSSVPGSLAVDAVAAESQFSDRAHAIT